MLLEAGPIIALWLMLRFLAKSNFQFFIIKMASDLSNVRDKIIEDG